MNLGAATISRVVLSLLALGLLWVAAAFAGFAVFAFLEPAQGAALAAALTAGILLLVLAAGVAIYFAFPTAPEPQATSLAPAAKPANQGVAAILAQLAHEHPFVAVACATLLGIADTIQAENRRAARD
jgi:beta-lactamase regulating signal transducer with metallopeptidase domain